MCSKWQLHGYLAVHACIVISVNISTKHFVIDWCAVFATRALKNACCHLTFEHAMDLAQSMEATDRNTKALQGTETAAVNQLTTPHLHNVTSSAYTASQLCYQIEDTLELSIHYCQVRDHIPARVQITFCLCSDIFKQLTIKDAVYWSAIKVCMDTPRSHTAWGSNVAIWSWDIGWIWQHFLKKATTEPWHATYRCKTDPCC